MTAAEATPELEIAADRDDTAFLGHPKGLAYLAFTETTSFWLLHAGFAAAAGAVFILFKLALQRHLVQPEG